MIVQCATFSKSLIRRNIEKKFRISVSGSRLNAVFGHPYSGDGPACWSRIQSGFRLKIWKIGLDSNSESAQLYCKPLAQMSIGRELSVTGSALQRSLF